MSASAGKVRVPLVIGEIGGSSSRWAVLLDDGTHATLPSKGMSLPGHNPLHGDAERFIGLLRDWFAAHAPDALRAEQVIAYGAGCGAPDRRERMRQALVPIWPAAPIAVDSDLLAAAHGLCGMGESALVLILGTGMNAGHWDGAQLHRPMPTLGWMLGDEGSGADIGQHLLRDAIHKRMPAHVLAELFGPEGPALEALLRQVYGAPSAARELASFTAPLAGLKQEPYVRDLVLGRFQALIELLKTYFTPEQRARVRATGSVAWGFADLLGECLLDHGMDLVSVERDPLPGLVRFHRSPASPGPLPPPAA
jgi:N-acetylglucosamine kinase-like BadF-type ATPase